MSRTIRGLAFVVLGIITACFGALVYGGFTAPTLPYGSTTPYAVAFVERPQDMGTLRVQDNVLTFNNQPFFSCVYLGAYSPIYTAPRNQAIPITYWRPDFKHPSGGEVHETTIVLRNLTLQDLISRGLSYLVAAVFLAVGAFFLIFRWPQLRWLSLACLFSTLLIASVPEAAQFRTPFSVAYWAGLPLSAICVTCALTEWPLNQFHRWIPRILIGIVTLFAVLSLGSNVIGSMGFNCAIPSFDNLVFHPYIGQSQVPDSVLIQLRVIGAFGLNFLPLFFVTYLLFSAYRQAANNRFVRTQVRTLIWVHTLVGVIQTGLGYGPIFLGQNVNPIAVTPYLITVLSLFLPITWAVVGLRSTVMGVEQFLSRTVFTLFVIMAFVIMMLAAFYGVFTWVPNPDPVLVTVVALVPLFLFNTLLRKPFERLVDLVLYGHHYDDEETSNALMQELNRPRNVQDIGRVLIHNIPDALLVDSVGFWAKKPEGDLALVDTWNVSREMLPSTILESHIEASDDSIIVHKEPFTFPGNDVKWYLTVKLMSGTVLEGVVLLGPKLRGATYSTKDTRVLLSLANWIGGKLAGWRLTELELKQEREQVLILVEHEAGVRTQVAEELHDRGITALSLVRRLVEQQKPPEEVRGALQRVIDDLRMLTSSHLKPSGLDFGLISGLDALVRDYEQVGANIELDSAVPDKIWSSLSDRQNREVFYIMREAVTNAFKADNQASIVVRVVSDGECLHFSVKDTGPGFDTGEASTNKVLHHGLSIMKARARNIEADLMIDSTMGVGTSVCVTIRLTDKMAMAVPL